MTLFDVATFFKFIHRLLLNFTRNSIFPPQYQSHKNHRQICAPPILISGQPIWVFKGQSFKLSKWHSLLTSITTPKANPVTVSLEFINVLNRWIMQYHSDLVCFVNYIINISYEYDIIIIIITDINDISFLKHALKRCFRMTVTGLKMADRLC